MLTLLNDPTIREIMLMQLLAMLGFLWWM